MEDSSEILPDSLIDRFVKDRLTGSNHGAHAYDHTWRVYSLAMTIGKKCGANLRVLGAAALLHDVGRPDELVTGVSHAISSGQYAKELLPKAGYSQKEIDAVVEAIRTHRFSERLEPTTLEGEIISDADKLDAIGAIGVFRTIAQGMVTGSGVEEFLEHAHQKLLKLRDLMHTEPAKEMANQRHEVLERFVNELKREMDRNGT